MSFYSKSKSLSGPRRGTRSLLILAVAFLMPAAAPGVAFADSAAEQYIEPQIPTVPSGNGGSNDRSPGNVPKSSDRSTSEPSGTPAGLGGTGADGGLDRPEGKAGKLEPNQGNKAQGDGKVSGNSASDSDADDDASAAAILSGTGGGSGGSSLELLLGLLVLSPLLAAGGYYLWQRFARGGDEQTRAQL